jgi:hypothetical protein
MYFPDLDEKSFTGHESDHQLCILFYTYVHTSHKVTENALRRSPGSRKGLIDVVLIPTKTQNVEKGFSIWASWTG